MSIWPPSCRCQTVREPGAKVTRLRPTPLSCGSKTSPHAVPVNILPVRVSTTVDGEAVLVARIVPTSLGRQGLDLAEPRLQVGLEADRVLGHGEVSLAFHEDELSAELF